MPFSNDKVDSMSVLTNIYRTNNCGTDSSEMNFGHFLDCTIGKNEICENRVGMIELVEINRNYLITCYEAACRCIY